MRETFLNDKPYFGFIRKQSEPLTQKPDATVTYVKGEIWRIVTKADELEDLDRLREFYKKEDGYLKARFSPDTGQENRFIIVEILED